MQRLRIPQAAGQQLGRAAGRSFGICIALMGWLIVIADPAMIPVARGDDPQVPGYLKHRFHSISPSSRRDNGEMMRLVKPLADTVGQSIVQVVSDGTPVSLGVIVTTDGYVLTKRSELSADPIRVRLPDSRLVPARVAAVRRQSDLALLRLEGVGTSLQPITFANEIQPPIGSFLISIGRGGTPVGLGVVSAQPHAVQHNGRLGIRVEDAQGGPTVQLVLPDSGAAQAGVKLGDRILAIDGRNELTESSVIQTLRGMFPGESVRLTISREGTTLDLVARIQDFGMMQETPNDVKVNGPRSRRLSGFEQAIQHDTVLDPDECGGPILDSAGRVVGLNIARAGRVVSYALPSSLVVPELASLLDEARDLAEEN